MSQLNYVLFGHETEKHLTFFFFKMVMVIIIFIYLSALSLIRADILTKFLEI